MDDCVNDSKECELLLAIFEKNNSEIGYALIDLKNASLILTQFSDCQEYKNLLAKIQYHLPHQVNGLFRNKMRNLIRNLNENIKIIDLKSRFFSSQKGLEFVNKFCDLDFKKQTEMKTKPLALGACSALFKYAEYSKNHIFTAHSIRLSIEGNENLTLVDINTARFLELVYNTKNSKRPTNLYGILNYTRTKYGAKALLSSILQPPFDVQSIQERIWQVEEMAKNTALMNQLIPCVEKFSDLDHFSKQLNLFAQKEDKTSKIIENKIKCVINMRLLVDLANQLKQILMSSNCIRLKTIFCNHYEDRKFETLYNQISCVIEEQSLINKSSLSHKINKCFAIKANISELLDVSRRAFTEIIYDIQKCCDELSQSTELSIKHSFNTTRGFYFQLNLGEIDQKSRLNQSLSSDFSTFSIKILENLPKEFLKITKTKNAIQFTTEKLLKINSRLEASMSDIYFISNKIIDDLISKVQDELTAFYKLREFITFLDLILSLTQYSISSTSLTIPQFSDHLFLENACHPILHKIKDKISNSLSKNEQHMVSDEKIVTNTIELSKNVPFLILTGSNMSGKSTLLRQLGDLQIMAQCGSCVPAKKAVFSLKNKILSLSGDFDDLGGSLNSSFECQINEMKKILENMTDNSLILIDEFCKHTNYYEGLAISFAVCKNIIDYLIEEDKKNVYIIFSTHYTELSYLESCYSLVNCYRFRSSFDQNERLVHSFELEKGFCEVRNYGQKLLEQSALPNSIVQDSRNLLNFFKVDLHVDFNF
ncbi:mutS -like protein [Brachionus plicatilis]|uniref:MutS-like protein n=1 Tax=Brachionus plicatilis TaxID=10195 RepID=A0A3M7PM15_BRAPC|nr:mutS -like protein [Brachionus plicatilis]